MSRFINGTDAINGTDIPTYRQVLALVSGVSVSGIASTFVPNEIAFGAPSGGGLTQDPFFAVDNINKRIAIGSGIVPTTDLTISRSFNGAVATVLSNSGTGTSTAAFFNAQSGTLGAPTATISMGMTGTDYVGHSTTPNLIANMGVITTITAGPTPTLYLGSHGKMTFQTGSTQQERIGIDLLGNITFSGITSNMIWTPSVGRLGIGPPGFSPNRDLHVSRGGTDFTLGLVQYTGSSPTGGAALIATVSGVQLNMGVTSSGFAFGGAVTPNRGPSHPFIITTGIIGTAPLYIGAQNGISFQTGDPDQAERIFIRSNGEIDLLNLSSGGLVKAIVPSGQLIIATSGIDYAVPGVSIIAGSGLAGGGDLTQNRTINIGAADGTITVNADTIQVGVVTTANIINNAVDNTKIRDSVATSVIGRSANSTGDPADIQSTVSGQFLRRDSTSLGFGTIGLTDLPGSVTSVSGVTLTAGAGLTGGGNLTANRTFDVVAADATITINPDSIQVGVIQNANIRTSAATSVIGRSANSIGQVADIAALASGHFLRRDGSGVLGFGTIVLSDLPPGITGGGGGGGDVFSTRQIIAGAGLTGGGNLTADRTFDVVAADGTIVVAADSIKVGIITNTNINDATISPVKLSSSGGPSLLGRDNPSSGSIKELDIVPPLHLENGDTELTIRPSGFSVLGRSDSSNTSNVENITATASGQFVNMNGSLAFRNIVTSDFPIAPDSTLLGNFSGSNVAPVYLHINQIRDLLSIGVGPFQFAYSAGFSSGLAPIDGIWISSSDGTASFARNQHFGWCAPGALGGTVYSKLRMTVNVLGFLAGGGRSVDVNATVNGTIIATMGSYNTTTHDSSSFNNIVITEGDEIGVKLTGTMNNFDVINIYVAIFIQ